MKAEPFLSNDNFPFRVDSNFKFAKKGKLLIYIYKEKKYSKILLERKLNVVTIIKDSYHNYTLNIHRDVDAQHKFYLL